MIYNSQYILSHQCKGWGRRKPGCEARSTPPAWNGTGTSASSPEQLLWRWSGTWRECSKIEEDVQEIEEDVREHDTVDMTLWSWFEQNWYIRVITWKLLWRWFLWWSRTCWCYSRAWRRYISRYISVIMKVISMMIKNLLMMVNQSLTCPFILTTWSKFSFICACKVHSFIPASSLYSAILDLNL